MNGYQEQIDELKKRVQNTEEVSGGWRYDCIGTFLQPVKYSHEEDITSLYAEIKTIQRDLNVLLNHMKLEFYNTPPSTRSIKKVITKK